MPSSSGKGLEVGCEKSWVRSIILHVITVGHEEFVLLCYYVPSLVCWLDQLNLDIDFLLTNDNMPSLSQLYCL